MLVDFEVENFRSYKAAKRLSMVASSAKDLPQNLIETDLGLNLVRTAVLYGPNASGKSNLLLAMNRLGSLLRSSVGISCDPFALDGISASRPTRFRVRFLLAAALYDYAIAFQPSAVLEERLVVYPHGRAQQWFVRKGKEIEFNATHIKGGKQSLRGETPLDVPLLAAAAAMGHSRLSLPAHWLVNNLRNSLDFTHSFIRIGSKIALGTAQITALRCHENSSLLSWVNAILKHADLGIQGVEIEFARQDDSDPMTSQMTDASSVTWVQGRAAESPELFFVHGGDDGGRYRFRMSQESDGTCRLVTMLIPLYDLLQAGGLAVVDELDESFHPSLLREILRTFHDPELNPKGAQLVFATHNTSLLSGQLFRRDQVWFTEKDASGATDLYSLNDIKGVREDESFEKGYLRGRYGAIPFFGSLDFPPVPEEPAAATT